MAQNGDSDGQRINVLVMQDANQDDSGMLRLLGEVTSPEIAVSAVPDLSGALHALATQRHSVVLLQLGLAGRAAEEIIDTIDHVGPGVPVILFGSAAAEREGIAALRRGATDYLVTETLNSTALGRVLRYASARAGLEARLRESERRYRALFEHTGVAMLLVEDDVVTMVNERAAHLLGREPGWVGQDTLWSRLLPPEEAKRVAKLVKRAGLQRPLQFELQLSRAPGEARHVVANLVAIPDSTTRIVSLVDLTEQLEAEKEVQRQREYFRALFENSPEGIVAFDVDGAVVDVNPAFERLFGLKRGELAGKDVIESIVPARLQTEARRIMQLSLAGGSYVPHAVRRRSDGSEVAVSILGAPIELDGRRLGGFGIYRDVTAQIQARERLEEAFIDLVETTARMMESVDPYTAGHQRMVARLADLVGRKLGLDDERLQGLYIGGLLHDIGKLSLPSTILTKPGKLTTQEWALIRSHPRRGYDVLLDAKLPWPVADMALRHHERVDGSGYPDGVSGEQLSLEARILGACDVVEAMSSDRPYRPALPMEAVLAELAEGSGKRYDSDVVAALVQTVKSGEIPLGAGYAGDN